MEAAQRRATEVEMTKLKGKVAIVTGAAGGIGRAAAKLFVREGAKVLLVDRNEQALAQLAIEIGSSARYQAADVSKLEDSVRYVRCACEEFGGIDVLFANAGVEGTVAPLTELSPQEFDRVWAVNVRGVFLGIKYAAPELAARGGGSIVITSSIAGLIGSPGLGAYVTSKHALLGLARTAALELASKQIRVNTINPGPIDNRMMRSIQEQAKPTDPQAVRHGFEAQVALGRYGTNEEIARLALFLASEDASYCTGGVYVADGGFTAQ
jgi:NAD(P)-dependent dehydrogenase (short-subunit alcohol dehydrogenase family)